MLPRDDDGRPTKPLVRAGGQPMVVLVNAAGSPAALDGGQVTAAPINMSAGGVPVLVFRDAVSGQVRAFDRRVEADLIPQFKRNTSAKHKGAAFIDSDTGSGWTSGGVAVDGPAKGKKLAAVEVQEDVWWHAAERWYPGLKKHEIRSTTSATNPSR